jgi:phosphoserine phosphatase
MANHKMVIFSAPPMNWVMPWCQVAGYDCIATILSVSAHKITGCIEGSNCYGKTKVDI